MPGNPKKKMKGSNLGAMLEKPKQKEGIDSERDGGEHEIKGRDRIRTRYRRTRNRRTGSNLGAMPKKSNKNKGIESGRDTKGKGPNQCTMPENPKQKEGNKSRCNERELKSK